MTVTFTHYTTYLLTTYLRIIYVAAKATYIRLLHGKICFFWGGGGFRP